ncbi:MAG: hypothetical protein ACLPWS_04280, partial [Rhodomicrobium sp.]
KAFPARIRIFIHNELAPPPAKSLRNITHTAPLTNILFAKGKAPQPSSGCLVQSGCNRNAQFRRGRVGLAAARGFLYASGINEAAFRCYGIAKTMPQR